MEPPEWKSGCSLSGELRQIPLETGWKYQNGMEQNRRENESLYGSVKKNRIPTLLLPLDYERRAAIDSGGITGHTEEMTSDMDLKSGILRSDRGSQDRK